MCFSTIHDAMNEQMKLDDLRMILFFHDYVLPVAFVCEI